jgi:2-keto-4-pentenoate hydratase/2-oxohepta-3-ene-1,7-dioic acid hydratase in catechol pathway
MRMRLVSFGVRTGSGPAVRAGVEIDGHVVDVAHAIALVTGQRTPPDLLSLVRAGESALDLARDCTERAFRNGDGLFRGERVLHDRAQVQLVAPLPRPNSLRDFMVVEEHVAGAVGAAGIPEDWYHVPAHYKGNVDEIYGPDDVVPWPAYTDALDYELEICAVIGTGGRRIRAEDAAGRILGYTLYNDWSARDLQRREVGLYCGPGISKDFASSIGPAIVTPDEFDRSSARLEARIDGEVWSSGSTLASMHFSFEELIEWTSQEQTLHPGDLLGSGTVGRGCGLELDRWIKPGCVVELEAEGIGVLRNPVGLKGAGPRRAFPGTATGAGR